MAIVLVFSILSICCSAQPLIVTERGAWPGFPGGLALGVAVASNVAYTVGASLQSFDIQTPSSPLRLSGLTLPNDGEEIVVTNGIAYIISESEGLRIVNVSNPTNPVTLAVTNLWDVQSIEVAGDYCYVSAFAFLGNVVHIFDVSTPSNLVPVMDVYEDGRLKVAGNYGYFAGYIFGARPGIAIYSGMSAPFDPVLLGEAETLGATEDISVVGTNAFVLTSYGLEIFDVSIPSSPQATGAIYIPWARRLSVAGSVAHVICGNNGDLLAVNVSNTANPVLLGTLDTLLFPKGIQVQGNNAYIADYSAGLQIVDVSDPANMQIVGNAYTGIFGMQVDVVTNHAYLANEWNGLEILDVSDPDSPKVIGHYDASAVTHGVRVRGNRAYVASEYFTYFLDLLDVSNPASPVLISSYVPQDWIADMEVTDSYAYLATGFSGLEIVDVSSPTNLVQAGKFNTAGYARQVRVVGNLAFIADGDNGLQILNVGNPAAPTWVGGYNTSGGAVGLDVQGSYAFIADGTNGLVILNVSNPAAPVFVGGISTQFTVEDVRVVGDRAYLSDSGGLRVLDVHDPANPVQIGLHYLDDPLGYISDLRVVGDLVYTASGETGLTILELTEPIILNPPILSGGMITLSWNGAPEIRLQRTTSLANPLWTDVNGSEGASGISVPVGNGSAFFRLKRGGP